jgi:hypothetical protein
LRGAFVKQSGFCHKVSATSSQEFFDMDVTAVVTAIAAAATPIALIGSATLLVLVGIKTWKWVRRAM